MILVDIAVDASVDMLVATRSTVGRVSVEYRPCVDLHVGRYVSTDMVVISLTLGRYHIDTLPIVYRYLTDTQSTHGQSMI